MTKSMLLLLTLLICFLSVGNLYAIGGKGATCNPSTANWGSCELATIPLRDSVTGTINVAGGLQTGPYFLSTANREYILQGDITFPGGGFIVAANNVVVNLNGFTVTYGETGAGAGFYAADYARGNFAVVNGSIIQGAAQVEGDVYGMGPNAILSWNAAGYKDTGGVHAANLYIEYGGRDVGGIIHMALDGKMAAVVEECTLVDTYGYGTLKNRHQGVKAINLATGGTIKNNTITNTRQTGISIRGGGEVFGNYITMQSIDTNSTGISPGSNTTVYENTIIGRGAHPIGVYVGWDSVNVDIFDNIMDMKVTRLALEYASYPVNLPYDGMWAAGVRMTSIEEHCNSDINIYNNQITLEDLGTDTVVWSHDGSVTNPMIRKGYGMRLGLADRSVCSPVEPAHVYNNTITVDAIESLDPTYGHGFDIAENTSDKLFIYNNTVTTNVSHAALGGLYSYARGYPLFQGNTFIKTDNYPDYATITRGKGGWEDSQVRFVDNIYQGGASRDSAEWFPSNDSRPNTELDVYFGTVVDGIYLYSYRMHDNGGLSKTVIREDFDPMITLTYAVPSKYVLPPVSATPEIVAPPSSLRLSVQ